MTRFPLPDFGVTVSHGEHETVHDPVAVKLAVSDILPTCGENPQTMFVKAKLLGVTLIVMYLSFEQNSAPSREVRDVPHLRRDLRSRMITRP